MYFSKAKNKKVDEMSQQVNPSLTLRMDMVEEMNQLPEGPLFSIHVVACMHTHIWIHMHTENKLIF